MLKRVTALGVILSLGLASGVSSARENPELEAFKEAIRVKYDKKVQGFAENDGDLVVDSIYSTDAMTVYPDGTAVIGRENLRPIYHETVTKSTVRIESVITHVEGDTGWDWTNFYVNPADREKEDFVFIVLFLWEKRDGEWWVTSDMFVKGELGEM